MYYFGKCSAELSAVCSTSFFSWSSAYYSHSLLYFFDDVYANGFFSSISRLWNTLNIFLCLIIQMALSLEIIQAPIIFDHFLNSCPICFFLSVPLFLVTPCFVMAVTPCIEQNPIETETCLFASRNFWGIDMFLSVYIFILAKNTRELFVFWCFQEQKMGRLAGKS